MGIKQPFTFVLTVLALLFCLGNGALALNILTDNEMTRISGHAGINIVADDLKLRMEGGTTTLNLNPDRSGGHYLRIVDDGNSVLVTGAYRDSDSVALTIGSGTTDTATAHSWQPATVDMHMKLDVGDDGTRTALNLALYNWEADMYLKADMLQANTSTRTNDLFGLNVGEINFADNGANPSMYMKIASHDSGTGISGELGMKLLIDTIGFTGINRSTPANPTTGSAYGEGLLFCQAFSDNASATHLGGNWSTDYWLANTASGMWTMGNLDVQPLTLDVTTYNNNQYIIMTIQGHFTKRFTYPDMGSTNIGSNTVWGHDDDGNGDITAAEMNINVNPNSSTYNADNTWDNVLGEVRLERVVAYVDGANRNIGGLSLEDLAMERTYMVMTPDGDPYSGHIYSTNALNPGGLETELPTAGGVNGRGAQDTTSANWNNIK
ncbi:hypothetical protein [Desulfosudis oleivorans]|nr:hypothetical protein [Desulfosudis oleivorans]